LSYGGMSWKECYVPFFPGKVNRRGRAPPGVRVRAGDAFRQSRRVPNNRPVNHPIVSPDGREQRERTGCGPAPARPRATPGVCRCCGRPRRNCVFLRAGCA